MNKSFCELSQKGYSEIEFLSKKKYLERPFAYEFYHQLRKLIDGGEVNFGGSIIQAEVAKKYQRCFKNGKIPDFIIHVPNTSNNFAVIEFKLATNLDKIKDDFDKLAEFKKELKYKFAFEVIIGNESSFESARQRIRQLNQSAGENIIIIEFDTDSWKVKDYCIRYHSNNIPETRQFRGHNTEF